MASEVVRTTENIFTGRSALAARGYLFREASKIRVRAPKDIRPFYELARSNTIRPASDVVDAQLKALYVLFPCRKVIMTA